MICHACRSQMRRGPPSATQILGRSPASLATLTTASRKAKKSGLTGIPARPYLSSPAYTYQVIEAVKKRPTPEGATESKLSGWKMPTFLDGKVMEQMIDVVGLEAFAGKTILEMNPGLGLFAEKIIEKVKPKRYIALESRANMIEVLESLKTFVPENQDTEIIISNKDGFNWSSFTELEQENILNPGDLTHDRSKLNPNIAFLAMTKTISNSLLIGQWLDTIGTGTWIQRYGRVRMYLFVGGNMRRRLMAKMGSEYRTRGTIIREATCEIREVLSNTSDRFRDAALKKEALRMPIGGPQEQGIAIHAEQFHPVSDLSLLEILPLEHRPVKANWHVFDFVTRSLFAHRTTPLHRQIRALASGAYVLLAQLPPYLREKEPAHMTVHEIDLIAQAFDAWPFKPRIEEFFSGDTTSVDKSKLITQIQNMDASLKNKVLDSEQNEGI